MLRDKKDILLIQIFIFLAPYAYGLFYEFTAYFAQVILLIIFLLKILKNKKIKIYINISSISLAIISIGYLISTIYAIDKRRMCIGMAEIYNTTHICWFNNAI